jgi:biopolymer transport protein ExbB/TolQ
MENATEVSFIQAFAQFMDEGGIFMWIILSIWIFGIAVAIERVKSLMLLDTNGASLMNIVKKELFNNQVAKAIEVCSDKKAILALVLKNGLKRANQEKEVIKDALETSLLDVAPLVEKRLNYLSLIANISTLVGLLGTIQGLIESFASVANADPSKKAELLALGISKAMNTTALGLVCAITIMVIHTILSARAEKIISETEKYSVTLLDILGNKKTVAEKVNQLAA